MSPNKKLDWVERELLVSLAPVSAAPAPITRHAAKAVCQTLATSDAGFPPVCVICSWRTTLCARLVGQAHKVAHLRQVTPALFSAGLLVSLLCIAKKVCRRLRGGTFFLEHQYVSLRATTSHNKYAALLLYLLSATQEEVCQEQPP